MRVKKADLDEGCRHESCQRRNHSPVTTCVRNTQRGERDHHSGADDISRVKQWRTVLPGNGCRPGDGNVHLLKTIRPIDECSGETEDVTDDTAPIGDNTDHRKTTERHTDSNSDGCDRIAATVPPCVRKPQEEDDPDHGAGNRPLRIPSTRLRDEAEAQAWKHRSVFAD